MTTKTSIRFVRGGACPSTVAILSNLFHVEHSETRLARTGPNSEARTISITDNSTFHQTGHAHKTGREPILSIYLNGAVTGKYWERARDARCLGTAPTTPIVDGARLSQCFAGFGEGSELIQIRSGEKGETVDSKPSKPIQLSNPCHRLAIRNGDSGSAAPSRQLPRCNPNYARR